MSILINILLSIGIYALLVFITFLISTWITDSIFRNEGKAFLHTDNDFVLKVYQIGWVITLMLLAVSCTILVNTL